MGLWISVSRVWGMESRLNGKRHGWSQLSGSLTGEPSWEFGVKGQGADVTGEKASLATVDWPDLAPVCGRNVSASIFLSGGFCVSSARVLDGKRHGGTGWTVVE